MAVEQADTTIGANVELKGSIHNQGAIHIYGSVTGDVSSDSLVVIGETATVNGPVKARQVDVSGQVVGSITAEQQIELQPKSIVRGDLITNRLSIKPGAVFVGQSQMVVPADAATENYPGDKKKPRVEVE